MGSVISPAVTALAYGPRTAIRINSVAAHVGTIISSTARHKVPAMYEGPSLPGEASLISYGASFTDMFRRAAGYVDRILRGKKPADLPVQMPTKFEMAVNLRTARKLGLNVAVGAARYC